MAEKHHQEHRRVALITGASAGLGASFATHLAASGHDLVLVARRLDRLDKLASTLEQKHGIKALTIAQDLSLIDAHQTILQRLSDHGLEIDVLVNNAGFSIPQEFANTDWHRQQDFVMTLVMAVTSLTHAILPSMIARKSGKIINVSSMVAWSPGAAGHTLYPAAKAYVLRFSQSLAVEVKPYGITVTATCPGSTETEFTAANNTKDAMPDVPKALLQSADEVVEGTLKAAAKGKTVYVPGAHNKLSVAMMRYLPDRIIGPVLRKASDKYKVD